MPNFWRNCKKESGQSGWLVVAQNPQCHVETTNRTALSTREVSERLTISYTDTPTLAQHLVSDDDIVENFRWRFSGDDFELP